MFFVQSHRSDHGSPGQNESFLSGAGTAQPSLIQYRSERQCVMEREKKKKKEWWEEENVLSDEEDLDDIGEKQPLYEAEGELLEF